MSEGKRASFSRRATLAGVGIAAVGAGLIARPSDRSGQRSPYFKAIEKALREAGIAVPTLVIDRARLDANISRLMADLPKGMAYRIVAKSLPAPDLIARIRRLTGTDRLMSFNLPMLLHYAQAMPDAGQLLGKPLPVAAAKAFFDQVPAAQRDAAARVVWLVDTPLRLEQYLALSAAIGQPMDFAIELDVGLHRGGQVAGPDLAGMLGRIKETPTARLAGLMGYEPHLASLPTMMGWQSGAVAKAWAAYAAAKQQVFEVLGQDVLSSLILNAAGSPTYRLYRDTSIANEVSVGSALVKPTDFDTPLLTAHQPAAFIATPVIKADTVARLPEGLGPLSGLMRLWDPNLRKTIFIHGGHWLAKPIDPPGLQTNGVFGLSSNQQMMNGGAALEIAPDDYVFFRPTQAEVVLGQFGDIAVFDAGRIVERWPVLPASG